MSVRAMLAIGVVAVLPFTAGSAHASCLDDATARDLREGYAPSQPSPHYASGYVQVTGTATVTVYGDALASDAGLIAGDVVRYVNIVGANAVDITTDFADCVAG